RLPCRRGSSSAGPRRRADRPARGARRCAGPRSPGSRTCPGDRFPRASGRRASRAAGRTSSGPRTRWAARRRGRRRRRAPRAARPAPASGEAQARVQGTGWRLRALLRSRALGVRRRALRPRRAVAPVTTGALLRRIRVVPRAGFLVLLHRALAFDEGPEVLLERELPDTGVLEHGHAGEVDGRTVRVGIVAAVLHVHDDASAGFAHVPLVGGVHLTELGHDRLDPAPDFLPSVLGPEYVLDVLDVFCEQ